MNIGKSKALKIKIPYHISLEDRKQFYVPALYQVSQDVNQHSGEFYNVASFTMITRHANDKMQSIHNAGDNKHRMPIFLTPEMEQAWVMDDLGDDDMDEFFHFEMPSDAVAHYPVYSIRSRNQSWKGSYQMPIMTWGKSYLFMARMNRPQTGQPFLSINAFTADVQPTVHPIQITKNSSH